jgi:diaminopimelate epimerase
MHGAGNDFVMVDARDMADRDWPKLAEQMCDRHFGIGADGLILVLPSSAADLRMRMFNPDGSEAEMCGNGIRCFTKLALEEHMAPAGAKAFSAETGAGILQLQPVWSADAVSAVRVNMGPPIFEPERIPVAMKNGEATSDARGRVWMERHRIEAGGRGFDVACVSMGNPHAIWFIDSDPAEIPLESLGPAVEHHPFFPKRVNFHVAQVIDRTHIRMRTWERGAGLTLACGTGACATAVAAYASGRTDAQVEMALPGGRLTIEWPGDGDVFMTGPAATAYSGEWHEGD